MNLARIAVRNVTRNKLRSILTVAGVAVAALTFVLLRTIAYAWTSGADYAVQGRIVTRDKTTFVAWLPRHYVDDVRALPGVGRATYANWFGRKDPAHDREFFSTIAVDATSRLPVRDALRRVA